MHATDPNITAKALPRTFAGEVKGLIVLGLPMAAAQLLQFVVYSIDAMMIGRLGDVVLAASAVGLVMFFVMWMLGSGAVMAVTPLVSQAIGANPKNYKDVRHTVRMSIWLVIALFPLAVFFALIAAPLARLLGQDAEVARLAGHYILALMFGFPFALIIMALRNYLAALEKTLIPLLLIIGVVLTNVFLNWVLIYGNLGAPALGLVGAGIASSLSYIVNFALLAAYVQLDPRSARFRVFHRWWRPNFKRLGELFKLAWPISITTFFEGMLFNAAVFIAGAISVAAQAAYHVALNVTALVFMVPFGLSMAGSVRIGHAAGAQNLPAMRRASGATFLVCLIFMAIMAVTVAAFRNHIGPLYLDETDAANAQALIFIAAFLPIAAAFMMFDGVQLVANQLLRGIKDVDVPMWITAISYWGIGFPLCYGLALHSAIGANGIWYGLMAGLFAAAVLLGWRLFDQLYRRPEIPLSKARLQNQP